MVYIPRQTYTVWGTPCHYVPKNELEYLVMKYPNKPWNFHNLAKNPNISVEFIENNLWFRAKLKNCFNELSQNTNITIDFINKYYHYFCGGVQNDFYYQNWSWTWVSMNQNMTKSILHKYIDVYPWNFDAMLDNPNIDADFVLSHIDKFPKLMSKTYEEIEEKLQKHRMTHNHLVYTYSEREIDIVNEKFADFDYLHFDTNNNEEDLLFWDDLSYYLFGYEDTCLYYEKRKFATIELVKKFKDKLLEVTMSAENLKFTMDQTEYEELMERWNHFGGGGGGDGCGDE